MYMQHEVSLIIILLYIYYFIVHKLTKLNLIKSRSLYFILILYKYKVKIEVSEN